LPWFARYTLPQNRLGKELKSQIRLSKGLTGWRGLLRLFAYGRRFIERNRVFLKSKEWRELICNFEVGVSYVFAAI